MTAKEIFDKVKEKWAKFNAPATVVTPAPVAAPALAAPPVPAGTPYTTQDGSTISIQQAGAVPAVGDVVTINGAPAPAGDIVLQDGSKITVDATGAISAYTPVAPVTQDPAALAAPLPTNVPTQMKEVVAKFSTGSSDERITNLETIARALIISQYAWQTTTEDERVAATKAAIDAYDASLKLEFEAQKNLVAKHEETIQGLFELVEKLVELPTADPATLTGNKKAKFERMQQKEDKYERIAAALKETHNSKKY